MLRAANDDEPTTFGCIPTGLDDLERLSARLRVDMAEDDVDHLALAMDALLVRNIIEALDPTPRHRPVLTLVG